MARQMCYPWATFATFSKSFLTTGLHIFLPRISPEYDHISTLLRPNHSPDLKLDPLSKTSNLDTSSMWHNIIHRVLTTLSWMLIWPTCAQMVMPSLRAKLYLWCYRYLRDLTLEKHLTTINTTGWWWWCPKIVCWDLRVSDSSWAE